MNHESGSYPVEALEVRRSKGIQKGPGNSRPSVDLTLRGDSPGKKLTGYNNDKEEMCQSS